LIQVEANLNSHVILNCNHVGVPKPNITWSTPQNQQISINHPTFNRFKYELVNGTSLRINLLEMKDAGSYRCSALNQYSHSYLRKKQGIVVLTVLNQKTEERISTTPIIKTTFFSDSTSKDKFTTSSTNLNKGIEFIQYF
jgi:hypothetical protein